jgi:hypothetical protein
VPIWELAACIDGFNRANGGEDAIAPPTDQEFEDAKRLHGDL